MPGAWFRSSTGSSYGPASREGWAIWSWLLSPVLVVAATIWLIRIVHTHSNRHD